jgi:hypothetical protein
VTKVAAAVVACGMLAALGCASANSGLDAANATTGRNGALAAAIEIGAAALASATASSPRGDLGDFTFNLQPTIDGQVFRVGDAVVVSVDPALDSGTRCYTCTVQWRVETPISAEWLDRHESGTRRPTAVFKRPGVAIVTVRSAQAVLLFVSVAG